MSRNGSRAPVDRDADPFEPSKFRVKKELPGPVSEQVPIMRSSVKKLSQQDKKDWRIPPCISNWKNPRGYVIPLDKRMGAHGPKDRVVEPSDRFASFATDLFKAERESRDELRRRAELSKSQFEEQQATKEDELREAAQEARRAMNAVKEESSLLNEVYRETRREFRMEKSGRLRSERGLLESTALGGSVTGPLGQGLALDTDPGEVPDSTFDPRLFGLDAHRGSHSLEQEDGAEPYDTNLMQSMGRREHGSVSLSNVGSSTLRGPISDSRTSRLPKRGLAGSLEALEDASAPTFEHDKSTESVAGVTARAILGTTSRDVTLGVHKRVKP